MASKTGLKQQCPHCEAIVSIKDEAQIGKRIRCPKCNEAFLVEDADDNAATKMTAKSARAAVGAGTKTKSGSRRVRDEDDDEGPKFKKKKGGANTGLIVGLGLGGVAVVALAVAAIIIFSGNNKKPNTSSSANRSPVTPPADEDKKPEETNPTAMPVLALGNITNMLPNDTEAAIDIPVPELLRNSLGAELFSNPAASSRSAERVIGVSMNDVERWIIGLKYSEPSWSFQVFRTKKPINFKSMKTALELKPGPNSPIQGQEFFSTSANWFDRYFPAAPQPGESESSDLGTRPLYVHLKDPQTLVLADLGPMKDFLNAKGQFSPRKAPPPVTGTSPNQPGSRSTPGFPGFAGSGGSNATNAPTTNDFQTVDPRLKRLLDVSATHKPYLFNAAIKAEGDSDLEMPLEGLGQKEKIEAYALAYQWTAEAMQAHFTIGCGNDQDAGKLRQFMEKLARDVLTPLLKITLQADVRLAKVQPIGTPGTNPQNPRNRLPGGLPNPFPPGGQVPPGRGTNPGQPGQPNEPNPDAPIVLTLDLGGQGRDVTLSADIKLKDEVKESILTSLKPYFIRVQGEFEMELAHPSPYDLAKAASGYEDKDKQIPPGAAKRASPPHRAGRPWAPDQRISFLAELLPYLGYQSVYENIKMDRSWRDKENLTSAAVLIPQFLDARSDKGNWYISYPGIKPEVAATHYVGMAGIGLDAPYYSPGDPAVADKRGIFTYDHAMPLTSITDKARTILMIQVPPTLNSPWIAGGGSTVRGVPEKNSVQPFVTIGADGKRGTTILMADGSVRWISEKIDDAAFQALCRLKGPKSEVNISKLTTVVPSPEDQPTLKATTTLPPAGAKEAPKAAEPEKKPAPGK